MHKVTKAVIPAAGMGTRFLPAAKALPKEMLPIVDKPAIQYIVEEAVSAGIENVLIVTGRSKRAIEDHFDCCLELELFLREKGKEKELQVLQEVSLLADVHFVRQKKPLGLGHALYCARKFTGDEPFAVLLGDDLVRSRVPCIQQLMEVYAEQGCTVVGVQEVGWDQVHKYGVVSGEELKRGLYRASSLVEKPHPEKAPSNLAVLGRYVLEPEIFPILEHTPPGSGGEIQLTDALNTLARQKKVCAFTFSGRRYDVGDRLGFLEASVEYALQREELAESFRPYLERLLQGPRKK